MYKLSHKCQNYTNIGDVRFNELLQEAIDNTLTNTLGENAKKELYIYLKAVLSLDRNNVGRELEAFHTGLRLLFGSGALSIENAILKELFSRIGLSIHAEGDFLNLVKKARAHFSPRKKSRVLGVMLLFNHPMVT